jgi:hypothetical protein
MSLSSDWFINFPSSLTTSSSAYKEGRENKKANLHRAVQYKFPAHNTGGGLFFYT